MAKITTINGREVDLDKIKNPKLKGVIQERMRQFIFNHSEHSDYDDANHTDRSAHEDRYQDDHKSYSEKESHTDSINSGSWYRSLGQKGHRDYTDRQHEAHNDYNDYDASS